MYQLRILFNPYLFPLITALCLALVSGQSKADDAASIERGRYLMKIAGCNDCHTAGYAHSDGKVAEEQWLLGDQLGWQGPWGTTYAVNLRLYMKTLSEEQWVKKAATTQLRPPMPWFALRDMTEQDLRSIYHYIKHLGPVILSPPMCHRVNRSKVRWLNSLS